jgi:starch phosphorylase
MPDDKLITYFSTEIALDSQMPKYSGGLGMLVGDTNREAAVREFTGVCATFYARSLRCMVRSLRFSPSMVG